MRAVKDGYDWFMETGWMDEYIIVCRLKVKRWMDGWVSWINQ